MTKTIVCCLIFIAVFLSHAVAQQPTLFGENIISTEDDELGITFTPDGHTCFFTKRTPSTISSSTYVICYSRFIDNKWSTPEIAPFSGRYKDLNPFISPDGTQLFFISNRPGPGKTTMDGDIWRVKKEKDGWSEPENVGAPINTPGWEMSCAVTANGSLYFTSLNTSTGQQGLYQSKLTNGKYGTPEKIGDSVNNFDDAADIYIAPDESYLLFSSKYRPDILTSGNGASASYPRSDLYISFNTNGKWTTPVNAGAAINSPAEETNPSVSPDGKMLFYTSERNFITIPMKNRLTYASLEEQLHNPKNGLGDIYQVPVSVLMKKVK